MTAGRQMSWCGFEGCQLAGAGGAGRGVEAVGLGQPRAARTWRASGGARPCRSGGGGGSGGHRRRRGGGACTWGPRYRWTSALVTGGKAARAFRSGGQERSHKGRAEESRKDKASGCGGPRGGASSGGQDIAGRRLKLKRRQAAGSGQASHLLPAALALLVGGQGAALVADNGGGRVALVALAGVVADVLVRLQPRVR